MRTLHNGLDVLEVVTRADGPVGIPHVCGATGLGASTVSRLLTTLVGRGYLRKVSRTSFAPDIGSFAMAGRYLEDSPLFGVGRPVVDETASTFRKPAYLGCVWLDRTVILYQSWVHLQPNGWSVAHVGRHVRESVIGQVICAHWEPSELGAFADKWGLDAKEWGAELEPIRRTGYSFRYDETMSDGVLAMPVRDASGGVVAGLSVQCGSPGESAGGLALMAARISTALGYKGSPPLGTGQGLPL